MAGVTGRGGLTAASLLAPYHSTNFVLRTAQECHEEVMEPLELTLLAIVTFAFLQGIHSELILALSAQVGTQLGQRIQRQFASSSTCCGAKVATQ